MLLALVVATCAVAQPKAPPATAPPKDDKAKFTSYCQERFLRDAQGKLYCNWGASFGEACNIPMPLTKFIEKGAIVSGPTPGNPCSNGHRVVSVAHN